MHDRHTCTGFMCVWGGGGKVGRTSCMHARMQLFCNNISMLVAAHTPTTTTLALDGAKPAGIVSWMVWPLLRSVLALELVDTVP